MSTVRLRSWATYVVIGLVAFSVGFLARGSLDDRPKTQVQELRLSGRFTNPLLECDEVEFEYLGLAPFKKQIASYVDERLKAGNMRNISVYFRDLNNGPWFGVDEQEDFSPASLLKVPLMIAYLRYADQNPGFLEQQIVVKEEVPVAPQSFKPSTLIRAGETYAVHELIERMIVYSDNTAATELLRHVNQQALNATFTDFGISAPGADDPDDFMSVQEYASFFRILFNASYLSQAMSERALEYLTRSEFRGGLVAGVPSSTVVAHKCGERLLLGSVKQLHDCGIVYYPGFPYVLCVMTRGGEFPALQETIAEISQLVYKEVDVQRREQKDDE